LGWVLNLACQLESHPLYALPISFISGNPNRTLISCQPSSILWMVYMKPCMLGKVAGVEMNI
jgi:hypothetical protein